MRGAIQSTHGWGKQCGAGAGAGAGAACAHQLGVVLLQRAGHVRVGVGHGDHRVGLARLAEARVVDAGDAHAERCGREGGRVRPHRVSGRGLGLGLGLTDGEGGLLGGEGHLVEDDRLPMSGEVGKVYKLTSPSGKAYVGQT
jgi:hypothetical protein